MGMKIKFFDLDELPKPVQDHLKDIPTFERGPRESRLEWNQRIERQYIPESPTYKGESRFVELVSSLDFGRLNIRGDDPLWVEEPPLGQLQAGNGFSALSGPPSFYFNLLPHAKTDMFPFSFGLWMISAKIKQVIEQFDPKAAEIIQIHVEEDKADAEPCYLMDVVQFPDVVDIERSRIKWCFDEKKQKFVASVTGYYAFKEDVASSIHLFRHQLAPKRVYVSRELASELKRACPKGIEFDEVAFLDRPQAP